jgi:two-component system, LuxR family, sensor kinase FixL
MSKSSHRRKTLDSRRGPDESLEDVALHDSEERLRAILATAVEGIITIDEGGIIESLNPAAERIFGYSSNEVIGQNVSMLMPSPYREAHDGYIANYLRTGHAKIIGIGREVVGRRKDGSIFPMGLAVSEVKLANKRLFTGFVHDVTERIRLEKEVLEISEREQRRIGQDLHDGLGQQLTAIEMMCESLKDDVGHASLKKQLNGICQHLRNAIGQTRSLAQGLAAFKVEVDGLQTALAALGRDTSSLAGIACRVECDSPISFKDTQTATHLFRIAQEAVNNAVKHGQSTEVTIRLSQRDSVARLAITDNGKGFSSAVSTSHGMGLNVMKHRAAVMGADLDIQSKPGKGVSVICTLRLNS